MGHVHFPFGMVRSGLKADGQRRKPASPEAQEVHEAPRRDPTGVQRLLGSLKVAVEQKDMEKLREHWSDICYTNFASAANHDGFLSFFEAANVSPELIAEVLADIADTKHCYFQPFYAVYKAHEGNSGEQDLKVKAAAMQQFCLVQCVTSTLISEYISDELSCLRQYKSALADWADAQEFPPTRPPVLRAVTDDKLNLMRQVLGAVENAVSSKSPEELQTRSKRFIRSYLQSVQNTKLAELYHGLSTDVVDVTTGEKIEERLTDAYSKVHQVWTNLNEECQRIISLATQKATLLFGVVDGYSHSFATMRAELSREEQKCREAETRIRYLKELQISRLGMSVAHVLLSLPTGTVNGAGRGAFTTELYKALDQMRNAYNTDAVEQVTPDPIHNLIRACLCGRGDEIEMAANRYRAWRPQDAGPSMKARFLRIAGSSRGIPQVRRHDAFGFTALHYFLLRRTSEEALFQKIYKQCLEDDILLPTIYGSLSPTMIAMRMGRTYFVSRETTALTEGMCDSLGRMASKYVTTQNVVIQQAGGDNAPAGPSFQSLAATLLQAETVAERSHGEK